MCETHSNIHLFICPHLQIGKTLQMYSSDEGRQNIEAALRMRNNAPHTKPLTGRDVGYKKTHVCGTQRLKTGFNKQEWETAHNCAMTLIKPGSSNVFRAQRRWLVIF